jgi:valyl-tRNA synthetase
MDKIYNQNEVEEKWYKFWEDSGFFQPEINPDGKPFTIILPPPNANADLHFGHAMMSSVGRRATLWGECRPTASTWRC